VTEQEAVNLLTAELTGTLAYAEDQLGRALTNEEHERITEEFLSDLEPTTNSETPTVNPFVSEEQRRYLWANEPEIAHAWAHGEHTGKGKRHNMPGETGEDVKGPLAKEERKKQKRRKRRREAYRMVKESTDNAAADQERDEHGRFAVGARVRRNPKGWPDPTGEMKGHNYGTIIAHDANAADNKGRKKVGYMFRSDEQQRILDDPTHPEHTNKWSRKAAEEGYPYLHEELVPAEGAGEGAAKPPKSKGKKKPTSNEEQAPMGVLHRFFSSVTDMLGLGGNGTTNASQPRDLESGQYLPPGGRAGKKQSHAAAVKGHATGQPVDDEEDEEDDEVTNAFGQPDDYEESESDSSGDQDVPAIERARLLSERADQHTRSGKDDKTHGAAIKAHEMAAEAHRQVAEETDDPSVEQQHTNKAEYHDSRAKEHRVKAGKVTNAFGGPAMATSMPVESDHHDASTRAATASVVAGHPKAREHAMAAMDASAEGDSDSAAASHVAAAKVHEKAATQGRKGMKTGGASAFGSADAGGKIAQQVSMHDQAAAMHRQAASAHQAVANSQESMMTNQEAEWWYRKPERRLRRLITVNCGGPGGTRGPCKGGAASRAASAASSNAITADTHKAAADAHDKAKDVHLAHAQTARAAGKHEVADAHEKLAAAHEAQSSTHQDAVKAHGERDVEVKGQETGPKDLRSGSHETGKHEDDSIQLSLGHSDDANQASAHAAATETSAAHESAGRAHWSAMKAAKASGDKEAKGFHEAQAKSHFGRAKKLGAKGPTGNELRRMLGNSNPEGHNQYSGGAGRKSGEAKSASDAAQSASSRLSSSSATRAYAKAGEAASHASEGNHKEAMLAHEAASREHQGAATHARQQGSSSAAEAHTTAARAHTKAARAHEKASSFTGNRRRTVLNRSATINRLVTNCRCWANGREQLEAMSDSQLRMLAGRSLAENARRCPDCGSMVSDDDEECPNCGADMTENAKTAGSNADDANDSGEIRAGGEEDDDNKNDEDWDDDAEADVPRRKNPARATPTGNRRSTVTVNEWLGSAPPQIQDAVRNAMEIEQRERAHLVNQLVANVTDTGKKKRLAANLMTKPLVELRDMVLMLPQQAPRRQVGAFPYTGQQVEPLFIGNSGSSVSRQPEEDKNDFLPLPSMNYNEEVG
jgi:hypothetical protein